jgi:alginate O-acetyltransferase complex protein AlgI
VLFNSFTFLIFLPVVFAIYWLSIRWGLRLQNVILLAASYVFYGWWSWAFLSLLIGSTLLDFFFAFSVASPGRRRAKIFLWLSIVNNLSILGIFKYYNFFANQFQRGFKTVGFIVHPTLLNIALPVGISFYTFHGMSYLFDIYRGKQKPVKNFVDYAVFVSFFPILVAGPIERAHHLLPQVQKKRAFNYVNAVEGCRLMLWGMFKKVLIADSLADIVNDIFTNYRAYSSWSLILGAIGFSFQVYCDFSGYTDIAIGVAKLFGFELLSNFKFPYFSRDIAEFWRRWHISLSSWFRDYLYIPLGGSKEGKLKAVCNTFIIFLVSGFWHGANWTFIAWGFIHACCFLPLLLLNRNRRHATDIVAKTRLLPTLSEAVKIITTFALVTFAWIFFRAASLRDALAYIQKMFTGIVNSASDDPFIHGKTIFLYIIPLLLIDWWLRRDERKIRITASSFINWSVYLVMSVVVLNCFLGYLVTKPHSFIYFQF